MTLQPAPSARSAHARLLEALDGRTGPCVVQTTFGSTPNTPSRLSPCGCTSAVREQVQAQVGVLDGRRRGGQVGQEHGNELTAAPATERDAVGEGGERLERVAVRVAAASAVLLQREHLERPRGGGRVDAHDGGRRRAGRLPDRRARAAVAAELTRGNQVSSVDPSAARVATPSAQAAGFT